MLVSSAVRCWQGVGKMFSFPFYLPRAADRMKFPCEGQEGDKVITQPNLHVRAS